MNQLILTDAVTGLGQLAPSSVHLTVTSVPYDDTFTYGGTPWNAAVWNAVIPHLWRVTKPGGIVCWQHRDGYNKDGTGQTGSTERQSLRFQALGFYKFEVISSATTNPRGTGGDNRHHHRAITPVYIFSKGRPAYISLRRKRNKTAGQSGGSSYRTPDGQISRRERRIVAPFGISTDLWEYHCGRGLTTKDYYAHDGFPALMHEELATDLIRCYSRPGQLVLDPFGGAGTTAKMALLNDRQYLSFEVWPHAHRIAERRLRDAPRSYQARFLAG